MKTALLIQAIRGSLVEREHYGYIILTDNKNILLEIGKSKNRIFYTRSCAKPFQAYPLLSSGAFKKFKITPEELAVCCASHAGTKIHTEKVLNILKKAGLNENHLKCGVHPPLDENTKKNLVKNNKPFTALHNNCSGKHAGMLAVCVHNCWNVDSYLDYNHHLQKEILELTKTFCGIKKIYPESLDGCKAPISSMPLYKMGTGYLNLFSDEYGKIIKKAFTENPFLIGGGGRLDTEIIKATNGRLIAKVGAEGLCIVVNTLKNQSLVVKIIDANIQARSIAVLESLKQLKWLTDEEFNNRDILSLSNCDIKTWDNSLIGSIKPVFKF
jgi:L-asparaginase II